MAQKGLSNSKTVSNIVYEETGTTNRPIGYIEGFDYVDTSSGIYDFTVSSIISTQPRVQFLQINCPDSVNSLCHLNL